MRWGFATWRQTFGYNSLGNLSFFKAPHQQGDNDWYSRSAFDARGRWVEFVKRIGSGGGDRIRLAASHVDNQATTSTTRLDGRGFQTKHDYDAAYRLVDVFRPGYTSGQAHRTTFEYDAGSRVKRITDGNSNVIDQIFDAAGRLTTRNVTLGSGVSVLADKEVYAYDEIGRLRDQHAWWAGGSLLVGGSTLARDGIGRITNEAFYYSGIDLASPVNISSGYTYSGSTSVGDPNFRRTLTYSSGANVRSVPDTVRRLKDRFFTPAGGAESLLGRYRYAGGITFHREQFYAGTSNKMVTDLAFDGYNRLTDLDHKLNGGASTHLEQYVWDAGSNLLKRKYPKQDGSAGDAYDYDKYDRLTGAKLGVSAGEIDNDYSQITSLAKEIAYGLDPGNSRSSVTVTLSQQAPVVTNYTTEADSPRYQDITGVAPPPLHDGEGNVIWDGVNFMVYDFRNRLSEVYQCSGGAMASSSSSQSSSSSTSPSPRTPLFPVQKRELQKARDEILRNANGDLWRLLKEDPQEARATLKTSGGSKNKKGGPSVPWGFPRRSSELVLVALYTYDTHNRRIARQVALPGVTADQRFAYDGWREVEELVPTPVGGSTQAVADKVFVWGRELDELLAYQRKESGNWVSYYPVQDRRESVVKLLDSQGNVLENVEYDPYGKATVYVGGSPQASSSVENPYLYQGRRVDPETGFVYMRNRYLHTGWGRFLTNDPIGLWGDAVNLGNGYGFVGNRPTMLVDLLGLQSGGMSWPNFDPHGGLGSARERQQMARDLGAIQRARGEMRNAAQEARDATASSNFYGGLHDAAEAVLGLSDLTGLYEPKNEAAYMAGVGAGLATGVPGLAKSAIRGVGKGLSAAGSLVRNLFRRGGRGAARCIGTRIDDAVRGLRHGRGRNVRTVDSTDELDDLYRSLSEGGTPVQPSDYPGTMVEFPDGSRIGFRPQSTSGGPAVDIHPAGGTNLRVHVGS